MERLRRISGWFQRFLGSSPVDRPVAEETTQVLPAPVEAARDWAKTIAITNRPATKPVEEPTAPMEIQEPVEASASAPLVEPEVIQPVVLDTATAEAPIVEPEGLPDLPTVEDDAATDTEDAPTQTAPVVPIAAEVVAEPALDVAIEAEPEPEPEPEAEPEPEPETEAEAVAARLRATPTTASGKKIRMPSRLRSRTERYTAPGTLTFSSSSRAWTSTGSERSRRCPHSMALAISSRTARVSCWVNCGPKPHAANHGPNRVITSSR